jgi:Na+:H+ antiporter, NhaA family
LKQDNKPTSPFKAWREFIQFESSGGIILFMAAVLAIIFENTPLTGFYNALFDINMSFKLGLIEISKPLLLWINDGLMAIFFLLVGLEIKREMLEGELNTWKKSVLPAVAAVGGMVFPALVYVFFNWHDSQALKGWAIPTATDIAFSLGIVTLLGSRIPVSLKIFLTALAIFDDIGAIVVIAIFYTKNISLMLLFIAAVMTFLLFLLNRLNVTKIAPYIIIGLILWLCVLKSGVHATLAGIIIALAIPLRDKQHPKTSPLRRLEHRLHPWVAFGVLPIFAFANAGIRFAGLEFSELFSPITLGIAIGLFVGKQIGVWLASALTIRLGFTEMPRGASYVSIYGISLIAGVGFTMSLFIGSLAFGRLGGHYQELVRLGVIIGSLLSGLLGYLILYFTHPQPSTKLE